MAWNRSTKQRKAMARRRSRIGDYKRCLLDRIAARVAAAERCLADAVSASYWSGSYDPAAEMRYWKWALDEARPFAGTAAPPPPGVSWWEP